MSDDKFALFVDNLMLGIIDDSYKQAWLERVNNPMTEQEFKRLYQGEWKPSSPEEHEPHCNLLYPLADCFCDCSYSKKFKTEHSVLNVPKIT